MFGLSEENINEIKCVLAKYKEVEEAQMFGSRAKGNYRPTSDVDIVLKGESISRGVIISVSGILNDESLMPYHFDIINYNIINSKALIEHIEQYGLSFYKCPADKSV